VYFVKCGYISFTFTLKVNFHLSSIRFAHLIYTMCLQVKVSRYLLKHCVY